MIKIIKSNFSKFEYTDKLIRNNAKNKMLDFIIKKKASLLVTKLLCHGTIIITTFILTLLCLTENGVPIWPGFIVFSLLLLFVYYISQIIIKVTNRTHPVFYITIHLLNILIPTVFACLIFSTNRIYFPVINVPIVSTEFKFVFFCISFVSIYLAGIVIHFLLRDLKHIEVNEMLLNENEKTRMKLLRMQMNPHFVYNCLVNLNDTIRSGNIQKAIQYNNTLSVLLRSQLEHSEKEMISLKKEIEWLEAYIKAETYRTPNLFDYKISYTNIDVEELEIPPMLLQPFIENSIKHVFLAETKKGLLEITIIQTNTFEYEVKIRDNGDGLSKKKTIENTQEHNSLSLKNIKKRIKILNEISSFFITINNKVLDNGFEVSLFISKNK